MNNIPLLLELGSELFLPGVSSLGISLGGGANPSRGIKRDRELSLPSVLFQGTDECSSFVGDPHQLFKAFPDLLPESHSLLRQLVSQKAPIIDEGVNVICWAVFDCLSHLRERSQHSWWGLEEASYAVSLDGLSSLDLGFESRPCIVHEHSLKPHAVVEGLLLPLVPSNLFLVHVGDLQELNILG